MLLSGIYSKFQDMYKVKGVHKPTQENQKNK